MEKHLFLTGKSSCGKSALIKRALGERLGFAGGYVTVGTRNEAGEIISVELFPAAAAAGIDGYSSESILTRENTRFKSNNEVFRNEGVRLIKEAEYYPFAVIDEFGGFELIIPQFREALLELLNSELPCIGVLTAEADGEVQRAALGLGEKYSAYRHALHTALNNDLDTRLVEMNNKDDSRVLSAVEQWVKEYA